MPNKTTILALASAAVTASAALASALLEEYGGEAAPETAAPAAGGEAATGKRGRPAAEKKAAGKTYEQLKEIIAPIVTGVPGVFTGGGLKLKAILKEVNGGTEITLPNLPPDKQEDFLTAIKPLLEELEAASI